ncbi:efflux RND transporter permease subunit [Intestinibacter bartlettii]|uniref:Efflux RND transporter permease subunit n=1 Tax=Intestinibacter bartlettii TaxID=261299 RepID=A0ABS6DUR7_9FIRM|nr:efflux RND transporter permease subunit [Intestinibacter bartlettii]
MKFLLPKFSVKKPLTVLVAMILILVLGVVSFTRMTTDLLPSMNLPYVIAYTTYPGASPEKVENTVTNPLEEVFATVSGVENITSISNENVSMVILEFSQDTNMDSAMIDLNGQVDLVKGNFDDSVGSTTLMKLNPDMMPVMMISVDIDGKSAEEISAYVNNEVIPKLERIDGVASVTASGLVESQLQITLDPDKIASVNEEIQQSINDKFDKQISEIDNSLSSLNESQAALEAQNQKQLSELNTTSSNIDKSITDIQNSISSGIGSTSELQTQLQSLQAQKSQIESSISALNEELSKASSQIAEQKTQLESSKQEIETARQEALKAADISSKIKPDMIDSVLSAENFSMPAGYVSDGSNDYSVKVGDKFTSSEEIENLLLFSMDDVADVYLKDVANIEYTNSTSDSYTNVNGNPGVILSIEKTSTASTSSVCDKLNNTINSLTSKNKKLHILSLMDQGIYIDMVIDSILDNLIYGGILAIIVLLIFLRSIKPTLIIALSIPMSLLFSVVLMYFTGISLNMISLSGLSLGIGMLVDNSIVVIENIYRMRNNGVSKYKAAVYGAKQVSGAIFASTLTTICVFLPIVFTDGITRQLFVDMGLTIAYSLIASLIIALTLVPCMASNVLTTEDQVEHRFFDSLVDGYEYLLENALQHKAIVLVGALLLLCIAGYSATKMGTAFMPEMSSTQMTATISAKEGREVSEADLEAASDEFIDIVKDIGDVEGVGAMSGSGTMLSSSSSSKSMSVYIVLKQNMKHTNKEIAQIIKSKTKSLDYDITVNESAMDTGSMLASGISIEIKGDNLDKLQSIANDMTDLLKSVKGVTDIKSDLDNTETEQRITVDKEAAMRYGLTVAQVYQQVSDELKSERNSTTITQDGNDLDVVIKSATENTLDSLESLEIKGTQNNEDITLSLAEIATVGSANTPSSIHHNNQTRYLTVSASVDDNHNIGLVSRTIQAKMDKYKTPSGYSIELTGENETINTTMRDLVLMIVLAIVFIYLIMVAQFQSLLSPFIVMFTIPLAFTGGLLALLITGQVLSVTSMLGFLVLAGIVVNNGIVFVDYVNQLRLDGADKEDALIEAGRTRIRPILMTAMTTILAMSTMALGVGMGSELSQGLSIVTIGGLLYATLLTLFVVPILYDILHRKEIRQIAVDEID